MAKVTIKLRLVRYTTPFAEPAWLPRAEAEARLADDRQTWSLFARAGMLSPQERDRGRPRIEQLPVPRPPEPLPAPGPSKPPAHRA